MATAALDPSTLTPGLMLLHGNRPEVLREVLTAWLQAHPLAPLENECMLVQSNGIAQWLRLAMAEQGVAAAVEFLLPARFVWQAYRAVLGPDQVPEASALDQDALVWRLMRLLPGGLPEGPGALADVEHTERRRSSAGAHRDAVTRGSVLERFLADATQVRKRYQLAVQLADLYDQYQVYRADWLEQWAAGQAVLGDGRGAEQPLSSKDHWQLDLWQALLADVDVSGHLRGRAAIHRRFMQALRDPDRIQRPAGLPRRIVVFGISSLPLQVLEALAGLGRWVQVVVCVHNPCRHYWADIRAERDWLRSRYRRQARRPGSPVASAVDEHAQTQPLLASWGRQGRDFIAALDDFDEPEQRQRQGHAMAALQYRLDLFESPGQETLLQQLQDDILDLRPLSETRDTWPPVEPDLDDSIRFQTAYSPLREVEALHDQLLAAFSSDPELRPRDIIIMVPQMDAYAAPVQAVFGLHAPGDRRYIPFSLADRGQRHADPLLIVLEQLLRLPEQRLTLPQLLEWLDVPAVRNRFDLHEDQLPLVRHWVQQANVRWGLDGAHKALFDLDLDAQQAHRHSWMFGLQRLLLGYAAGLDAPPWQGVEPCPQATGLDAVALGCLARLLDTLAQLLPLLQGQAPPETWVVRLNRVLQDCLLPATDRDERLLERFRGILLDWQDDCLTAGFDEPLPLAVVAEHCMSRMDSQGLQQRFFAGAVTFATLMPMRAIPFRRVYLLGMNDGDFPRPARVPDFDLMAQHPRAGDRSRRTEDRYLFLEALLSARDHLCISWVGNNIHDNSPRPPSVLVAQLRAHLDRGWQLARDGVQPLSAALTTHHPLQPFSPRYFAAQRPDLYTYAREWREPGEAAPQSLAGPPLPAWTPSGSLHLADLSRFLRRPVGYFMAQRLQVPASGIQDQPDEVEPFEMSGLQRWHHLQGILSALERVAEPPSAEDPADPVGWPLVQTQLGRMQRAGDFPDGASGALRQQALADSLRPLLHDYQEACEQWSEPVAEALDLRLPVALADGDVLLEGRLAGWRRNAQGQWGRVHLIPSDLVKQSGRKAHYQLHPVFPAWVEHVAAHVQGRAHVSLLFSPKGAVQLAPLDRDHAGEIWRQLWLAWQEGLCAPPPVEARTALLWLRLGAPHPPGQAVWDELHACYEHALKDDPRLSRYYPDLNALSEAGFYEWAHRLYASLDACVRQAVARGKDTVT